MKTRTRMRNESAKLLKQLSSFIGRLVDDRESWSHLFVTRRCM